MSPEEKILLETLPELAGYVRALKKRSAGRGTLALRRLLSMVNDYRERGEGDPDASPLAKNGPALLSRIDPRDRRLT